MIIGENAREREERKREFEREKERIAAHFQYKNFLFAFELLYTQYKHGTRQLFNRQKGKSERGK